MAGVPSNIMVPFMGVEFDNSAAFTAGAMAVKVLLIAQKTSAGTGTAGTTVLCLSENEARTIGGAGSQIHLMAKSFFLNNSTQNLYVHVLADESGSTAMAGAITITATSAMAGELCTYIDGERISVAVAASDTPTLIGDKLVAALTAKADVLPIGTFLNTDGVVSFAALNKGTVANGIDVRFNYNDGEYFPSGVGATFAVTTPGATDPDMADVIAVLGEEWYQIWTAPYTDATNLELIETELASRFGAMRQNAAVYISAKKDTVANLVTFATNSSRNSPHVVIAGAYKFPSSIASIAAAIAGQFAFQLAEDAAVPLHRSLLNGILAPRKEERDTVLNRNTLASNGIMTLEPNLGVQTDACVTMYLKNSAGASDTSYQQVNTLFTLMVLGYRFRQRILGKYPKAKLADSVVRLRAGQQVITPEIGKAEAIGWFLEAEADGLVENYVQFKESVQCMRDPNNRNRLIWLLTPDLMNQLIVGSAQLQFRS